MTAYFCNRSIQETEQEDHGFKVSLDYIGCPCLKKNQGDKGKKLPTCFQSGCRSLHSNQPQIRSSVTLPHCHHSFLFFLKMVTTNKRTVAAHWGLNLIYLMSHVLGHTHDAFLDETHQHKSFAYFS